MRGVINMVLIVVSLSAVFAFVQAWRLNGKGHKKENPNLIAAAFGMISLGLGILSVDALLYQLKEGFLYFQQVAINGDTFETISDIPQLSSFAPMGYSSLVLALFIASCIVGAYALFVRIFGKKIMAAQERMELKRERKAQVESVH